MCSLGPQSCRTETGLVFLPRVAVPQKAAWRGVQLLLEIQGHLPQVWQERDAVLRTAGYHRAERNLIQLGES